MDAEMNQMIRCFQNMILYLQPGVGLRPIKLRLDQGDPTVLNRSELPGYCKRHIDEGAHELKKRIERAANCLFLWSEHRGFQLINSVKTNLKMYISFYLYLYDFSL